MSIILTGNQKIASRPSTCLHASVIRLDRGNIEHLIKQYEEVNGLEGYDFDPELDFLLAAKDNSSVEDEILIICLVIDDGTTHDLGSDDDY